MQLLCSSRVCVCARVCMCVCVCVDLAVNRFRKESLRESESELIGPGCLDPIPCLAMPTFSKRRASNSLIQLDLSALLHYAYES